MKFSHAKSSNYRDTSRRQERDKWETKKICPPKGNHRKGTEAWCLVEDHAACAVTQQFFWDDLEMKWRWKLTQPCPNIVGGVGTVNYKKWGARNKTGSWKLETDQQGLINQMSSQKEPVFPCVTFRCGIFCLSHWPEAGSFLKSPVAHNFTTIHGPINKSHKHVWIGKRPFDNHC